MASGPDIAQPGSYVDDVRFNGDFAYLTDAGKPGLIIVNLKTGAMRRVLENNPRPPRGTIARSSSEPIHWQRIDAGDR
jgi:hypothetical protein